MIEHQVAVHLTCQMGGEYRIACSPNDVPSAAKIPQNTRMMTGDPRAVTCEACRGSTVYRKMMSELPRG